MPHPVLYSRATKNIIQTPPVLDHACVFVLQHHSLRCIRCLAQNRKGALGSVMHSHSRGTQSQHCWELPPDAVPITLVLLYLCQQEKCGPLGSSSPFNLLMETSASTCQQCTFKCGTHSLALQRRAWPHPKGASCALQLCQKVHPRDSGVQEQLAPVVTSRGNWVYTGSATQGIFMQLFIKMYNFASKIEISADVGVFLVVS